MSRQAPQTSNRRGIRRRGLVEREGRVGAV